MCPIIYCPSISYDSTETSLVESTAHFDTIRRRWASSPVYFTDDAAATQGYPVIILWSDLATSVYSTAARASFSEGVVLLARNAVNSMPYADGNFQWVAPTPYYVPNLAVDWGGQYYEDFDWIMARQVLLKLT